MADGDERVGAFWRELGLPGLIDVHTHFMPERVMAKVWAYFDAAGPLVGRRVADRATGSRRTSGWRCCAASAYGPSRR